MDNWTKFHLHVNETSIHNCFAWSAQKTLSQMNPTLHHPPLSKSAWRLLWSGWYQQGVCIHLKAEHMSQWDLHVPSRRWQAGAFKGGQMSLESSTCPTQLPADRRGADCQIGLQPAFLLLSCGKSHQPSLAHKWNHHYEALHYHGETQYLQQDKIHLAFMYVASHRSSVQLLSHASFRVHSDGKRW